MWPQDLAADLKRAIDEIKTLKHDVETLKAILAAIAKVLAEHQVPPA